MVFVCMVRGCKNSSKLTMKKCKRFRIPSDESRRRNWLKSCNRLDLLEKSSSYHVCSDHFEVQMYKTPERKKLLPTAVPTDFSMISKEDTLKPRLKQKKSVSGSCSSNSSSQSFEEADITELMKLGYSREEVIQELKRFNGNKNQAMASLFAKILKF
ncbi:unnamed protein product [Macrosiphum euphorbiae]|uniref:THAP-type domain-containing protein n=1 Tax=Macrosiphum euphorbiae TaxID=13131 RepID=A0AAV0Y3B2_9HEMI|nr:unnamed protein product [Macrosiphum euphorbiae]